MAQTICKYVGTLALFASLFYLVIIGKLEAAYYASLVIGGLTGFGLYHVTAASNGGGSTTPNP